MKRHLRANPTHERLHGWPFLRLFGMAQRP
jgi:hypothetical protein